MLEVELRLSCTTVPPSWAFFHCLTLSTCESLSVKPRAWCTLSHLANNSNVLLVVLLKGESERKLNNKEHEAETYFTHCSQRAPPCSREQGCFHQRGAPRRASRCGCMRNLEWPEDSEGNEAARC